MNIYLCAFLLVAFSSNCVAQANENNDIDWDSIRVEVEDDGILVDEDIRNESPWLLDITMGSAFRYVAPELAVTVNAGSGDQVVDASDMDVNFKASVGWKKRHSKQYSTRFDLDIDLFLNDRKFEDDSTSELYKLGHSYIQYQEKSNSWLKVGNLLVPFGTAEAFRSLDLFNADDERRLGIEDASEVRLPTPAIHLSFGNSVYRSQLAVSLAFRSALLADSSSIYDPFIQDRESADVQSDGSIDGFTPEWILSNQYYGAGYDVGLVFGEVYNRSPVLTGAGFQNNNLTLKAAFTKSPFIGITGSIIKGNWLLRSDLVWHERKSVFLNSYFSEIQINPATAVSNFETATAAVSSGIEFSGIRNIQLFAEHNVTHLIDYVEEARADEQAHSIALGVTSNLLNGRLELTARAVSLSNNAGRISQIIAGYELSDISKLNIRWTGFSASGSSSFFYPYRNNDSVSVDLKFSL